MRRCERARRGLGIGGAPNLEGGRQHLRLSPLRQTQIPPLLSLRSAVPHLITFAIDTHPSSLTASIQPDRVLYYSSISRWHPCLACSVQCSPCTLHIAAPISLPHPRSHARCTHQQPFPFHAIPVAPWLLLPPGVAVGARKDWYRG